MPTDSDQAVLDVLEAIAETERVLGDLARRLRERADVSEVVRGLNFGKGPSVDLSTTAELINGEAVSWGIELGFKDGEWVIESSVRRNHGRGQDAIRNLPTRHAITMGELVQELLGSVHMLVAVWSDSDPMFPGHGYGE